MGNLKVSMKGKVNAILDGSYKSKSFSHGCTISFQPVVQWAMLYPYVPCYLLSHQTEVNYEKERF
jgi:hypothetical protein